MQGSRAVGIGAAYLVAGLLACLAVGATTGPHGTVIAGVVAVLAVAITVLALVGPDGLGMAVIGVCFFIAPYFRAFPIVPGTAISAIDPLLVLGAVLLFPRITRGRTSVSSLYIGSAVSFIVIGLAAALAAVGPAATATLLEISQSAFLALMLPIVFMALKLSTREITWFATLYIAGQMLSTLVALATGPNQVNGRYQGLAGHPNYFADGAMMSIALLLYLYHHPRAKGPLMRWIWWITMAVCLGGINISGCRAAALGAAAILVLVPLVEKSPLSTFLGALVLGLGAILVQPLLQHPGQGSTLARLSGQDGTGTLTTSFRLTEWHDALQSISHSPFLGNGLTIEVLTFHNNYLELTAGIGIFGLVAYLVMLWSLTRGLFSSSAERRILYPMIGFIVFGLTEPGFQDRSNWLPMFLGIAVFHGFRTVARDRDPEVAAAPALVAAASGSARSSDTLRRQASRTTSTADLG